MPDTPEHRAAMTALARSRVAQGLPKWRYNIELTALKASYERNMISAAEYVQAVAKQVRESPWGRAEDRNSELDDLLEAMAACDSNDDAAMLYDHLYDLADYDRAWLET